MFWTTSTWWFQPDVLSSINGPEGVGVVYRHTLVSAWGIFTDKFIWSLFALALIVVPLYMIQAPIRACPRAP